jgi:hypothetical protein
MSAWRKARSFTAGIFPAEKQFTSLREKRRDRWAKASPLQS